MGQDDLMGHMWKVSGSFGQWVVHIWDGQDGPEAEMIGPFSTRQLDGRTQAAVVAEALNNAYLDGMKDGPQPAD